MLKRPDGLIVYYALCLRFPAFNSMVEYEAFINGMQIALGEGTIDLRVNSDP